MDCLHMLYFISRDGSSMGPVVCVRVCVHFLFYAKSVIHSLEMNRYITCVIRIKVGPAFLLCSAESTLVSFTITRVWPLLSYKSGERSVSFMLSL